MIMLQLTLLTLVTMKAKLLRLSAATLAIVLPTMTSYATNGMNMEGYGPVAPAMGGASMAYDNGTAAVINNPATLSLMDEKGRLDVADASSIKVFGTEFYLDAFRLLMEVLGPRAYLKRSSPDSILISRLA